MASPFFSFVVSCCNVEPYIAECLQSILNQSFRDWECILGIETSNDRTEEIIREKTSGDSRFKLFTGPRTGSCSASRNTGIDMAQGEYIIFLDGDDSIADGCLERLHEKIMKVPGADLYPCAIIKKNEIEGRDDLAEDNYEQNVTEKMSGAEASLYLLKRYQHHRFRLNPMLQMSIHRREFLVEHGLKCVRGLRCQDNEFFPRALYLSKSVVPLHEPFYVYRIRPNSVQTGARGAGFFLKDWAIITKSLLAFYDKVSREEGFDERITPYWAHFWFNRMNFKWFSIDSQKSIPREERLEWLKFIFEDGFDSYSRMIKTASIAERIAAYHIQMFVKHPSLRWYGDLFFRTGQRFYSLLS